MRVLQGVIIGCCVVLLATSFSFAQGVSRDAGTPSVNRASSVAVIDINYLFDNYDAFQRSMKTVQGDVTATETFLRDKRQEIVRKAEQLKSLPANSANYASLEEELANEQTQLNLELGRRRKAILDKEAKIHFNAYREVEKHVSAFADRYGIDLVIRYDGAPMDLEKPDSVLKGINRIIVFQRDLNITQHILQELNGPQRVSRKP